MTGTKESIYMTTLFFFGANLMADPPFTKNYITNQTQKIKSCIRNLIVGNFSVKMACCPQT